MDKKYFVDNLSEWHAGNHKKLLPWKQEKDPYKIWLREIILQQTRVQQGLPYYERFTKRFPTIAALASADEQEVFKLWEGLGYYSRCRNMIETARYIASDLAGNFPDAYEPIRALKGVGPYTAAAIASFAFGLPHAVIDGNVKRVLARFFGIRLPVDTNEGKKLIEKLAQELLPAHEPAFYNQAIMDFGAAICKPTGANCIACPLREKCRAYQHDMVALLPQKSKRTAVKKRFFTFLVIHSADRIYIRQRTESDIWRRLYEFPQIEADHLLSEAEIVNHPELKKLFSTGKFYLKFISAGRRQQLTHRTVFASFAHISSKGIMPRFMDAVPLKDNEINVLAFPKIIAQYLDELANLQQSDVNADKAASGLVETQNIAC